MDLAELERSHQPARPVDPTEAARGMHDYVQVYHPLSPLSGGAPAQVLPPLQAVPSDARLLPIPIPIAMALP